MSDQSYTTSFSVEATPREVFLAINNVSAWWNDSIEEKIEQVGDEFIHNVPDVHRAKIRLVELTPESSVRWRVLENKFTFVQDPSEWVDTEIQFTITESDGTTTLHFTHEGLVPEEECYDICQDAWGGLLHGSLRSLITTGVGQPMTEAGRENAKKMVSQSGPQSA